MPKHELYDTLGTLEARLWHIVWPNFAKRQPRARQKEPYSKLNQWREILNPFIASVKDATEKQFTNVAVKTWLDEVQDVVGDIENVIDEFDILASEPKSSKGKTSISSALSSAILDITTRLEELNSKRNSLGLTLMSRIRLLSGKGRDQPCLPTERGIFGRDEDKTKILAMVLSGEPSDANFNIIPIVGTGGVGKTTLAQLIYNDKAVEESFRPRAWVGLSHHSDALRISKAILESVTSKSFDHLQDLNEVQIQLTEALLARKFLLVLDDVSSKNCDYWETLKSSFGAGAPGSKIIVTTRTTDVAFTISPNSQPYNLEPLSDDDCWSVFAKYAFERADEDEFAFESDVETNEYRSKSDVETHEHKSESEVETNEYKSESDVETNEYKSKIDAEKDEFATEGDGEEEESASESDPEEDKSALERDIETHESASEGHDEKDAMVDESSSKKNAEADESASEKDTEADESASERDAKVDEGIELIRRKFDEFKDQHNEANELIRRKVVERCGGLPLAARILGRLLHFKSRRKWEGILDNEIWDLAYGSDILRVLKLSYHYLPAHLKSCLAFCAILPKNYEFKEKELILLWMGQGLLGGPLTLRFSGVEEIGSRYFRSLCLRFLFQQSSGDVSKFRMHDLIEDMVKSIWGETNYNLEGASGVNEQPRRWKRTCCSYTSASCDGINKLEAFYEVENLRTFLPGLLHDDTHYMTDTVLLDLLPKLKNLRVLSLEKQNITELPISVQGLRYLRYLNLSYTRIRSLPDSICSLLILQILLLRDCFCLIELPSNMRNLVNLRHLDIAGANLIREMPSGMKELKCLRILSNFIVGKDSGSDLKDLANLNFLRGELCISRLDNVAGSQHTGDRILINKKKLKVLLLEWGFQFDDTRNELAETNVLDMLQPYNKLKELTIRGYGGIRFSSWVGDPSFSKMVVLRLEGCEKCTSLPSLGDLRSLKDLTIKGMTGLKCIGSEIYGRDCSNPFQSLETLRFEDLQEWEHWDSVKENEHIERFPHLSELALVNCPNLIGNLPNPLPSLKKLIIDKCGPLMVSSNLNPRLLRRNFLSPNAAGMQRWQIGAR